MHSVCLSVRPSVHALVFENIFQVSWNLYILIIPDTEWTLEKMVWVRVSVRQQRHTKLSDMLRSTVEKYFKRISTYCTKCNDIYIFLWGIQQHVSYVGSDKRYLVCNELRFKTANCRKYSSKAFKFNHAIHIWYKMGTIENDMCGTKGSFTQTHKNFLMHFDLWEGSF